MIAKTGVELLEICDKHNISLSEYAIRCEIEEKELTRDEVIEKMRKNLKVMISAANEGMEREVYSVSGLIGGDGFKLHNYAKKGKNLTGTVTNMAMAMALSSSEVNASMGKIVACPTAGSCGILPAVILSAGKKLELDENGLLNGLFAAAAVGIIIGLNATLSGAEGGCQAECGSASAMGAAAVVEMMGGTPQMSLDAAAIILKNVLGLVCDPVAGLVEIPCAKRNAQGAITALCAADMVMAGVASKIPFDDTVSAMYKVGKCLPPSLRETALGGVAITKEGLRLKEQVFGKEQYNKIEEIYPQLIILCEYKALQLELKDNLMVKINRNQIKQVIFNLTQNAILHTDKQTGIIKISTDVEKLNDENFAVLKIIDNGTGISEEHIDKIQDRFFRSESHRSREHGGYGLGLSIVKSIIDSNHGEIHVDSHVGVGTTFSVYLKLEN